MATWGVPVHHTLWADFWTSPPTHTWAPMASKSTHIVPSSSVCVYGLWAVQDGFLLGHWLMARRLLLLCAISLCFPAAAGTPCHKILGHDLCGCVWWGCAWPLAWPQSEPSLWLLPWPSELGWAPPWWGTWLWSRCLLPWTPSTSGSVHPSLWCGLQILRLVYHLDPGTGPGHLSLLVLRGCRGLHLAGGCRGLLAGDCWVLPCPPPQVLLRELHHSPQMAEATPP